MNSEPGVNNWKKTALATKLVIALIFVQIPATAQIKDSATAAAYPSYNNASFIRRFFMGGNYRQEWSTPVRVPVFDLKRSGLKIDELGGGMQTKSLKLKDKEGREWALRSVAKDGKGALPENLRNQLLVSFIQDMISASHPYAALPVGYLAKSAGVVAPQPVLYFVPDDPAFGDYRKIFANTLCFLEEREPTPDKSKAEDTKDVLADIVAENDHLILQQAVLKARLIDMLVADWDRHEDQWKWGIKKEGGSRYYYAIPRDRDQAFFMSKGLIPRIAKIVAMNHINCFTKKSRRLKNLNYKTWGFDKIFLNELDKQQWETIIKEFQAALPDTVIVAAVKKFPKEIYAFGGEKIEKKLISRRNTLLKNALKYYDFISGTVNINGTAEREAFSIFNRGNQLVVQVHRLKSDGTKGALVYERAFNEKETGIIYLNGMDGDDHFFADGNSRSKIKINIDGGKGDDKYDLKGKLRVTLTDSGEENNKLPNTAKAKH